MFLPSLYVFPGILLQYVAREKRQSHITQGKSEEGFNKGESL